MFFIQYYKFLKILNSLFSYRGFFFLLSFFKYMQIDIDIKSLSLKYHL